MNYRHAYHAGNFADVLKHAVLAMVIEHLKVKPQPFRIVDTHAGIGLYDLADDRAARTGEWRDGIGRVAGPDAAPLPEDVAECMRPYLDVVAAVNEGHGVLDTYPGSPVLARHLMRDCDRLVLAELHPDDADTLAARFSGDKLTKVLHLDGWIAVKSLLPPPERRGVVLIDAAFEERDEFTTLARALSDALKRFRNGIFVVWYPLKDRCAVDTLLAHASELIPGEAIVAELSVGAQQDARGLSATGLLVVNPPWTMYDKLRVLLPFLAMRLGRTQAATHRLERISRVN